MFDNKITPSVNIDFSNAELVKDQIERRDKELASLAASLSGQELKYRVKIDMLDAFIEKLLDRGVK